MSRRGKRRLSPAAFVALSFLIMILTGTALLCIPAATKSGKVDFYNALFTAVSASCVTGLVLNDVASYWSGFGQAIILILIQLGGIGFITLASVFLLYIKKHVPLSRRKLIVQSAGGVELEGVKNLVKTVLIGTLSFEFVGAFLLCFAFVPDYGWGMGIWQSVFTSVSAFCNSGFALTEGASSLTGYYDNVLVMLVVSALVIVGGVGFFVWSDVLKNGVHFRRYSLHSKIALSATGVLILLGWVLFAAFEWNNPETIGNDNAGVKILASLFLSITPRTAGFRTIDYAKASDATRALTAVYMLIGGCSGSCAGGLKTTTVAVVALYAIATARRHYEAHIFKRKLEDGAIAQATTVIALYAVVIVACVLAISAAESGSGNNNLWFEVVAVISTTGLSCNVTANFTLFSQILFMFLMYFGRVGGYTMLLIFASDRRPVKVSRVTDKVIIG